MSTYRFTGRVTFLVASIWLGAIILSILLYKFAPAPYVWIGGLWAVFGFIAASRVTAKHQTIWLIFASVCIAVSASEYLIGVFLLPPSFNIRADVPHLQADEDLGWRNVPDVTAHVTKQIAGTTIYSVQYTIDGAGHRISPPDRGQGVQGCAVFFANSFVFGEGVNDEEAFPYRVGVRTAGRFRIVNLGVGGYGPHHMLAELERDDLAAVLQCTPTHVFYLALPHHVPRVADKAVPGGPRYELGGDGEVHRKPRAKTSELILRLQNALRRANSYQLIQLIHERYATSESDLKLYFAVVARSAKLAKQRWPSAQLHILAWNIHEWYAKGFDRFRRGLAWTGWQIHEVDAALPGYQKDLTRYGIHRLDLHPNSLAHDLLAAYIANNILQVDSPLPENFGSKPTQTKDRRGR